MRSLPPRKRIENLRKRATGEWVSVEEPGSRCRSGSPSLEGGLFGRKEAKHLQGGGGPAGGEPSVWRPRGVHPGQAMSPSQETRRLGSGRGRVGRHRLGAGSQSCYAGAPVPARPPSSGLAAPCARRGSGKGSQPQPTAGAASSPLRAAILRAKGRGQSPDGREGNNSRQWAKPNVELSLARLNGPRTCLLSHGGTDTLKSPPS